MRATRWPALIAIPLVLATLLVFGRADDEPVGDSPGEDAEAEVEVADPGRPPAAMPTASAPDDARSTWYCPVGLSSGVVPGEEPAEGEEPEEGGGGGTTTTSTTEPTDDEPTDDEPSRAPDEDDLAEPREYTDPILSGTVLVLSNVADEARAGTVTVVGTDGPVATTEVEVPARGRAQLDLADLVDEPGPVASLVELDGGGVGAAVLVDGLHGSTVASCSSEPAGAWHLPAAATRLDARAVLHLFNPFSDDAIVEISLTDRTPPAGFEAFPVPAQSVVSVELTDVITVRPQFGTTVRARDGQVVAALVQEYDGSSESGVEGLAVVPGTPALARSWHFPSASWSDDVGETYILYNPGTVDAQADLAVSLDDPETNGSVAPFEVTVPAGGFTLVGSNEEDWSRVPPGVGHSVIVRVRNEQPIVAAQRVSVRDGDARRLAMALGSPEAATEWIVVAPLLRDAAVSLTVQNPSPLEAAAAEVTAFADGEVQELASLDLPLTGRGVLRTDRLITLDGRVGARVTAGAPVVVANGYAFGDAGRSWLVALPVAGTTVTPELAGD